jgi:hypothetical protein
MSFPEVPGLSLLPLMPRLPKLFSGQAEISARADTLHQPLPEAMLGI